MASFVHTLNISNLVIHKQSLKFKFLFLPKFRFDWAAEKLSFEGQINKLHYGHKAAIVTRGVLMRNIADSVPSISSFLAQTKLFSCELCEIF